MKTTFSCPLYKQYVFVSIISLSMFTTGISLSWPSPVLVKLRNSTETPLSRPITDEEGSWIVSFGILLSLITNFIGGLFLDLIGRKYCLFMTAVPKLLVCVLYIFATEVWMVLLGRSIMWILDCWVFVITPVYSSEIAGKDHRGSLGSFLQICSALGSVVTLSVGPFTSYKVFNVVMACMMAITALPLLWIPDSPFFLFSKGKTEECLKILTALRGSDLLAQKEIEEYIILQESCKEKTSKISLLKNKTFLKSLALSHLIGVGSQIIGFNVVFYYLQTILDSTSTNVRSEIASVIIGVLQFLAACCAPFVMKNFGRRTVLFVSLTGMLLGMIGLGTFFEITSNNHKIVGFINYLPTISLILVIFCYSGGVGSLILVITAEVFDGYARAFGVSLTYMSINLVIFVTTKCFPLMNSSLGAAGTYWIFASATVIMMISIAYFFPEIKGMSFNEIQNTLCVKDDKK